jgi:hypothetical protein
MKKPSLITAARQSIIYYPAHADLCCCKVSKRSSSAASGAEKVHHELR